MDAPAPSGLYAAFLDTRAASEALLTADTLAVMAARPEAADWHLAEARNRLAQAARLLGMTVEPPLSDAERHELAIARRRAEDGEDMAMGR